MREIAAATRSATGASWCWARAWSRRSSAALAVIALLAAAPAAEAVQPRVINGSEIAISAAPWQVGIIIKESELCGGSIIAPTWIVTAAHCFVGASAGDVSVHAGISNLQDRSAANRLNVAALFVHPGYETAGQTNDIALIQLAAPISPSDRIRPIALPSGLDAASWPAAGSTATVTGWGATSAGGKGSDVLRSAPVVVQAGPSETACLGYGEAYAEGSQLCAYGPSASTDTCQGDSGGPLSVIVGANPVLAGITSVGDDCAKPNFPGLYTRVTSFLPWIGGFVSPPTAVPGTPAAVSATASGRGAVRIAWQGAGSPLVTVTSSPAGGSCQTYGASCEVKGLTPGRRYTFSVVASNQLGTSAAASSPEVLAPSGALAAGKSVQAAQVASWAGLRGRGAALSAGPSAVCSASGGRLKARAPGTCLVTVRAGGRSAAIAVAVT